ARSILPPKNKLVVAQLASHIAVACWQDEAKHPVAVHAAQQLTLYYAHRPSQATDSTDRPPKNVASVAVLANSRTCIVSLPTRLALTLSQ
ncbi:hypothetical protein, partial [Pseudoalteromonas sp. S3178]|uniref:hypothetical protein n=1 Tax=Pseudoalteromonas sp. S3178 TaxID=579532 RepID=UPI001BB2B4FE